VVRARVGHAAGDVPAVERLLALPTPNGDGPLRIQLEPELAVLCDVARDEAGAVATLTPRWVAAFDDCSWRRPGAAKISEKKHWGAGSKGVAEAGFAVSDLDPEGQLAALRLACFLRRDDATHAYGVDSAVPSYTSIGEPLLDWLVNRLRYQRGADDTPLEDVGVLLAASEATQVLVGIGATRYEPYGETTFVQPGDEAIVVLYDGDAHEPDEVEALVAERRDDELHAASVLRRVAAGHVR
jgi:hypothetical protein